MILLSIGDVARETGTAVSAIRFYEQIGLLPKASRQSNNRRCYGPESIDALHFISACRKNGMGLSAIGELRTKLNGKAAQCESAAALLQTTIKELSSRIAGLQSARLHLSKVASACSADTCGQAAMSCNIEANMKVADFA